MENRDIFGYVFPMEQNMDIAFPQDGRKSADTLSEESLRLFLDAFYRWREGAQGPGQHCSRSRVLFVCLLIRFGGLRLGEALSFDHREDLLAESSRIRVRGKWARELPLPRSGMKKLLDLAESPCFAGERGSISRLDQGYVRRIFEQRAQDAGLDMPMNPSTLRHFREGELLRGGVPLPAVERFLGKLGKALNGQDMVLMEEAFRRWERERHVGRYNSFRGRVERVEQSSFSHRITLACDNGLSLRVRCSSRTAARLGVQEGLEMNAGLRMLDISFAGRKKAEARGNVFTARLLNVLWGEDEVKATFAVAGGSFLRSIFPRKEFEARGLETGSEVRLMASEESFMLSPAS